VPRLHCALEDRLNEADGAQGELAPFLRMGSWIGGDRDGNPFVTAEVMRGTLRLQSSRVLRYYLEELHVLGSELSLAAHLADVSKDLRALAERSPGELTPRVKPEKQPLYRLGLKSFFEEGRSLAQISHTSVVSVLNFFRENETVYMVMNYLQGDTLQDFIVTARDLKRDKVFRESTIRSLFDEILRGLRIVHQHKMLHLDIKPANIFITNENKAVLLDFGAAREVLSKEGNFIRPMYTPGFAAPEMYRRDGTLGPWTDIYAIGACIYACMQGYPPNDAPQRIEKDRLALSLSRLRNVYSDNLIEVTEWCMSLDPLSRPQSVFALQKELSRETERQYTKLSFSERLKLQLENLTTSKA